MKNLLFTLVLVSISSFAFSQDGALTAEEKNELLAESPFNSVYPESILKSSDAYFKAQMGLYQEGVIAEKEAHLIALGTSAAVKCQYCIPYHISELKRSKNIFDFTQRIINGDSIDVLKLMPKDVIILFVL